MKRTDRKLAPSMAVNTKHMWQDSTRLADGGYAYKGEATVLWTRKTQGVTTVFLGELIGFQDRKANSVPEWMGWFTQPMERRRSASYNGNRMWHRGAGLDSTEHILEQFHATGQLPAHFEGWWTPTASIPRGGYGHIFRPDDPHVGLCATYPLMVGLPGPVDGNGDSRTCPACVAKNAEMAAV